MDRVQVHPASAMTIHLPTKPFHDALSLLQPLASSKSLPQLGAVTIQQKALSELVNLSATNLDVWMLAQTPAPVSDPFSFAVPSEILYKALGRASTADCTMELSGEACTLTAGAYSIRLPLITEPSLPVPEVEWGKPFTMEMLPNYFHKLLPFCSRRPDREILQSIHMSKGLLQACSGQMFARLELPCKGEAIIPTKLAELVAKMTGDVKCRLSPNLAEFSGEDWVITGKVLEGFASPDEDFKMSNRSAYPNTDCFLGKTVHASITVDRKQFIEAIQSVAVSMDKVDGIWARNTAGEMRLETPKRVDHPSSMTIPAKSYNCIDFAFSASEMATGMRSIDAEQVTLTLEDRPTLITCQHGNTTLGIGMKRLET